MKTSHKAIAIVFSIYIVLLNGQSTDLPPSTDLPISPGPSVRPGPPGPPEPSDRPGPNPHGHSHPPPPPAPQNVTEEERKEDLKDCFLMMMKYEYIRKLSPMVKFHLPMKQSCQHEDFPIGYCLCIIKSDRPGPPNPSDRPEPPVSPNPSDRPGPPGPSDRPGPPGPPHPYDKPGPNPHGHGHPPPPPPPPFLQNVTEEGRKEYFEIANNQSLTIQQIDEAETQWASTYNVSESYEQYKEEQAELHEQINQNVSGIVANLASVQESLNTILENNNQTRNEQEEAVKELHQEYPIELDTLFFIANHFGPKNPPNPPPPPPPEPHHHHDHQGGRAARPFQDQ